MLRTRHHGGAGSMNVTLDTNCIIALESDEPAAEYVRRLVCRAAEQTLRLRVVAITASEWQSGGNISESFCDFEAKIARVGLQDAEILLPPCVWDVTYWDHCIMATDEDWEEVEEIHRVLSPTIPLDPAATPEVDGRKWRNHVIDTLALWTHIHNGAGVFVTSDSDFHGPEKRVALARLGSGEILRPSRAAMKYCPTYPAAASPAPGD